MTKIPSKIIGDTPQIRNQHRKKRKKKNTTSPELDLKNYLTTELLRKKGKCGSRAQRDLLKMQSKWMQLQAEKGLLFSRFALLIALISNPQERQNLLQLLSLSLSLSILN
ncbi:hypothetical protein AVEN_178177-1 [Araneus ventricosus]|uniref:Uncharacterized protein n=1 Tax=Araneus ventricosus TaxID=182803 RepID=A0A4Y2HUY9_ARAVE|nr:hypothetical protein AVEN_178177-1 [Araneus ventricosus]